MLLSCSAAALAVLAAWVAWTLRHLRYAGLPFLFPALLERRLAPWVTDVSADAMARAQRSVASGSARILFVAMRRTPAGLECDVLGSSGTLYTVTIGALATCTCPDFLVRGAQCKHLLYVKIHVLRLPKVSDLLWQRAYLSHELSYMLQHAAASVPGSTASAAVRALITGEGTTKAAHGVGEPCPICCMDLEASDDMVACGMQCGHLYHTACIEAFKAHSGEATKCALCGAKWVDQAQAFKAPTKAHLDREYTSYAALTGQAPAKARRRKSLA